MFYILDNIFGIYLKVLFIYMEEYKIEPRTICRYNIILMKIRNIALRYGKAKTVSNMLT